MSDSGSRLERCHCSHYSGTVTSEQSGLSRVYKTGEPFCLPLIECYPSVRSLCLICNDDLNLSNNGQNSDRQEETQTTGPQKRQDTMCLRQISHHRCGHEVTGEWRKCRPYLEKEKSEGGPSFFRLLFRSRPKCKNLAHVHKDIPTACSAACARKREDMRRRQEKELKRREEVRKARAQAALREYAKNTKRELEALRLQMEEEERRERRERNGKSTSTTATFTRNTQPLWEAAERSSWPSVVQQPPPPPPPARVEVRRTQRATPSLADRPMPPQAPRVQQPRPTKTEVRRAPPRLADRPILAQAPSVRKTSSTRVEAQRVAPRLPDGPVLPQTNRRGNRPSTPISRTQANIGFQGRPTQTTQTQSRLPLASTPKESANSVSRSNGHHLRRDEAGTLDDPRVRLRAAKQQHGHGKPQAQQPDVQTVAARKPVVVSSPAFIASPSRASVILPSRVRTPVTTSQSRPAPSHARKQTSQPSPTQSRPPVPPKDKPPVPPKPSWQPQHPDLAPKPLDVRPKAPGTAVRPSAPPPSSRPTGNSRVNPTTAPPRKRDSVSAPPPRS